MPPIGINVVSPFTRQKFPVPVGFIITSASCDEFFAGSTVLAPHLLHNLKQAMVRLEKLTGKQFHQLHVDNDTNVVVPLLVSVRASPVVRLPGMTDTILNVGINDRSCAYLAKHFDNPVYVTHICCQRSLNNNQKLLSM